MDNRPSWFVSANMNHGVDQTSRFLEEGIWENRYTDKYIKLVKSIQVGDRIAIKITHNRKTNLPFDFHGKLVSVMSIKAIGVVTKNKNDGNTINVKWNNSEPKEWYFFTHIRTVWKVEPDPDNWMVGALIDFAFFNKPQEVERFRNKFYNKKHLDTVKKLSYRNEIVAALMLLGKEAHLSCIQEEIRKRNRLEDIHTNPDWQAMVRGTLQRFSSDSKSFAQGEDLFYSKSFSSGIWGLRERRKEKIVHQAYSKKKFLSDVRMKSSRYEAITTMLKTKNIIILNGVTGISQKFLVENLAFSLLKEKDKSRVLMLKFQQSAFNEAFLVDDRPIEDERFLLKSEVFLEFCKKAIEDNGHDCYFIIDDINRENLSKIIGELMVLTEGIKRRNAHKSGVLDFNQYFYIPENLYIIGVINTANKNLEFIDNILRQTFNFIEIEPGRLAF